MIDAGVVWWFSVKGAAGGGSVNNQTPSNSGDTQRAVSAIPE